MTELLRLIKKEKKGRTQEHVANTGLGVQKEKKGNKKSHPNKQA